jgi:hypothetical protein
VCSEADFVSVDNTAKPVADFFATFNTPVIDARHTFMSTDDVIITFSHFVPREELCPEKRFLLEPQLTKVASRMRM